jgi:hypothetical protein
MRTYIIGNDGIALCCKVPTVSFHGNRNRPSARGGRL